jgi:type I restriction enzyme M protein
MTLTQIQQEEINRVAWKACDTFRGVVDPSDYKNYILVMLFLKYISDVWRDDRDRFMEEYDGDIERVNRRLSRERFIIPADCDYYYLYEHRNATNIGELIDVALEQIEEANKSKLEGVFRNISYNSNNLGDTKDRNRRLKNLLEDFAHPALDLRPSRIGSQDIIGSTYEYLIARFASDSGKKGGEFYTPEAVSILLAKLLSPRQGDRICDPACGSGSLLIRMADEVGEKNFALYGQESNGTTWALCRMNMFLHGKDAARIEWGDTLNNPKLIENDTLMKFDIVVANPPFSLDKWSDKEEGNSPDKDIFNRYHRGTPPKSKADFAFISHMIETAHPTHGKVGVVAPHGVLFRSGAEGKIRRKLIEDENLLEAVIGLPENLFYGTGIAAAILIFNRGKQTRDVLFIDASNDFEQGKNQNRLRQADIQKIVETYRNFETVEKYSYRATFDEIAENDFNLNIPRYVDTFEEDAEIDIRVVQAEIESLETQLGLVRSEMDRYLQELELV